MECSFRNARRVRPYLLGWTAEGALDSRSPASVNELIGGTSTGICATIPQPPTVAHTQHFRRPLPPIADCGKRRQPPFVGSPSVSRWEVRQPPAIEHTQHFREGGTPVREVPEYHSLASRTTRSYKNLLWELPPTAYCEVTQPFRWADLPQLQGVAVPPIPRAEFAGG